MLWLGLGLGLGFAALPGARQACAREAYSDAEVRAVETPDEAHVRELRDQEINQIRIALGLRAPTDRRAELYRRLAETYVEAYRAEFLLEGRVHEKRLEEGHSDKLIDRSHSKPFLGLGIKACKEILRYNLPSEKLDQVYFFLGYNYLELGRTEEGMKYFVQMTEKFQNSPYVAEAYREQGDAAMRATEYRKAQRFYELAVKAGLGEETPRVLHRLAWTYYRTRDYERAVATMKDAIAQATQNGEKLLSVREEALRDMAVFMTETGRVDEAIEYFKSVAGDKSFYPRALERLGREYERNVEPVKATQVYESLLKTHPDDEAAFRVRAKLVDLDLRRGKYADALNRIKGVEVPSGGEPETQTAAQNLRAMIRRTATEHHEKYRKTGDEDALKIADSYYTAYIATFLSRDDSRKELPEIEMYLADVKRELGQAKEASDLYRKVIDSGDARYAKEAGALWTASLAEAIRKSAEARGSSATGAAMPADPTSLERAFVEAADDMQGSLGETNEGREAALKAAQVLAGFRNTQKEAIERARKLVASAPKSPQALTAARLWIQVLSDRVNALPSDKLAGSDEAEELDSAISEIRSNAPLMANDQEKSGSRLRMMLAELDNRLKVGSIASREQQKDFEAAAKGYESYAAGTGKRDLAEKAYANAIATYVKVPDLASAGNVMEDWLKRYPRSQAAVGAIRSAATALLIQGNYEGAAGYFEKLGLTGLDGSSLETSARVFEGIGEYSRAKEDWTKYTETYSSTARRFAAILARGKLEEFTGEKSDAKKSYRLCMVGSAEVAAECGCRLGDLQLSDGEKDDAKATFKQVASRSGRVSPFVGYSRYRLAELLREEASFAPLQLPEEQLKKALTQRLDFLEPLNRAYKAAVEAGGPWAIAALDSLASWALNFADEVDRIVPPAGAEKATIALFQRNLRSVSEPLRKRAIQTWMDAYKEALRSEIFSPALPKIVDRLALARAAGQTRAQGFRGRFRLSGMPADGGKDGAAAAFEKVRSRLGKNPQDALAWVDYGNLLWGDKKPLLAKIAYERALALDSHSGGAMNNRAVVAASGAGEEDWLRLTEAVLLFKDALRQDDAQMIAKINRAALLNYYRLFAKAKPLWDEILRKFAPYADGFDGAAVAHQGTGDVARAEALFAKADQLGAPRARFVRVYNEAARNAHSGLSGAEKCLKTLDDLSESDLQGFEKESFLRLKEQCQEWKNRSGRG